jgi:hypothetical protein
MGKEILDTKLKQVEIKQTRSSVEPIRFTENAINKVRKENYVFGKRPNLYIPFEVSKDSHLKGLKLRIYKGAPGQKDTKKVFYLQFWFGGKADKHSIGQYNQRFGVRECDEYLINLVKTHTDSKTRFWIKDPNETKRDEKRLIEKPDTTLTAGKSINEVIEDYCKGGFEKDNRVGSRTFKSCQIWLRYMAGYNNRQLLVEFADDDNGEAVPTFRANKHLRINAPRD